VGCYKGSTPYMSQHIHFLANKFLFNIIQNKVKIPLLNSSTKEREAQVSVKLHGITETNYASEFNNFGS